MTGRREQFIVEGIPANLGGQHSIQLSGVLESVPESSECISVLCLVYPKVSQRWGQSVSPAILSLSGSYCSRTSFDHVLTARFCFSFSSFPFLFNFDGSIVERWPRESSTHLRGTLIGHQRATTKALSDSQWGRKPSNTICENSFVQSCTICFRRDVTPIELHFRFLFLGVK